MTQFDEVESWISNYIEIIEPIEKEYCLEHWKLATTGKKEHQERFTELLTEYRTIHANTEDFAKLCEFRKMMDTMPELLARQVDLLWSVFAQNQFNTDLIEKLSKLESEVDATYNNFRGEIDGKKVDNNAIREILKNENDNEKRRKAWEASKQIGPQVNQNVLEMVKIRNEGAEQCGFKNYYSMSLELDELDETKLFKLLKQLEEATREPFLKKKSQLDKELAKRFGVAVNELRPWHYSDPFFQEAPPTDSLNLDPYFKDQDIVKLTQDTFQKVGLPIEDMLENSDLFGRDGKDQHAFCTAIGRSKDVRVLCNIQKNEYWMSTMLHEYGHAVYDYYLDFDLPFTLRSPAHILSTEAIAMLFGRLTRNPNWMTEILKLDAATAKDLAERCHEQQAFGMLVLVRWILVMCHFERDLYQKPDIDLNRNWWKYVEQFQDVRLGKDRDLPDWAAKLHLARAPVYYQNYLLGELLASQLQSNLIQENSENWITAKEAGTFLKDKYFAQGARMRWDRLLENATGETLNIEHFLNQFVR